MSWKEVEAHLRGPNPPAVLLPLGAVEAHGPHLPLDTDTIIAERLAELVVPELKRWHSIDAVVAHALPLSVAGWASDFPGTVSLEPETEKGMLLSAIQAFRRAGARRLALINVHFDPGHLAVVKAAIAEAGDPAVLFTDFTRRALAERIGGEFVRGACHGGQFETSLILAARAEAVRPGYKKLKSIDLDLAAAIRSGKKSFREVGLNDAYCGDPASATSQEGHRLYSVLASLVVEEAARAWPHADASKPKKP